MISLRSLLAYAVMLVSIPALWLLLVRFSHLPAVVLPPPDKVGAALWRDAPLLWDNTRVTVFEALLGYAWANALALALALMYLYFPISEAFLTPWMVVIKNVPFVTVASILLITLGDTLTPKIIVVVLVSFFPILANLVKGLGAADPVLLDRLKVLNASRWQLFAKVRWPAALPYYLAAHEIAFTGSIIGAIVAEWFFSRQGLGYLIVNATVEYRTDRLYAVTLIASLLAIAAYLLCKATEFWLFRWKTRPPA